MSEQNISRKRFVPFLTMITGKNQTPKILVDKGNEHAGKFKKLCKTEGIQFYSTLSETTSAFAERTKRFLKNFFYQYVVNEGYKYIQTIGSSCHKPDFQKKLLDGFDTNRCQEVRLSVHFCTANHHETTKIPNLR